MITEMRGAFFLIVSAFFFMAIIGLVVLGVFMKPSRWIERPRQAS
jgi:hypothetical protein